MPKANLKLDDEVAEEVDRAASALGTTGSAFANEVLRQAAEGIEALGDASAASKLLSRNALYEAVVANFERSLPAAAQALQSATTQDDWRTICRNFCESVELSLAQFAEASRKIEAMSREQATVEPKPTVRTPIDVASWDHINRLIDEIKRTEAEVLRASYGLSSDSASAKEPVRTPATIEADRERALELRHLEGYRRHPVEQDEFGPWEQVWGD